MYRDIRSCGDSIQRSSHFGGGKPGNPRTNVKSLKKAVKINDAGAMVLYIRYQLFLKIDDYAVIVELPALHTNTAITTRTIKTKKGG